MEQRQSIEGHHRLESSHDATAQPRPPRDKEGESEMVSHPPALGRAVCTKRMLAQITQETTHKDRSNQIRVLLLIQTTPRQPKHLITTVTARGVVVCASMSKNPFKRPREYAPAVASWDILQICLHVLRDLPPLHQAQCNGPSPQEVSGGTPNATFDMYSGGTNLCVECKGTTLPVRRASICTTTTTTKREARITTLRVVLTNLLPQPRLCLNSLLSAGAAVEGKGGKKKSI